MITKADCIVQARLGSSRLPGKVLLTLNGKSILDYVINQLKFCKLINKIVIATTNLKEDDPIENFAKKNKIDFFRGDSSDVLDRFFQCAKKNTFQKIVRVTADNPLIDPTIVDNAIQKFITKQYDYLSNHIPRSFPQGTEVEIFSFASLEKAWNCASKKSEREHVTPYFYNNPQKFKLGSLVYSKDISNLRWSIDKENDLILVKNIVSKIKKNPILLNDILELFKKDHSLFEINKNHIIDEGYNKSLEGD
jgi:spore coat polysaccharide biosynthesis protein SpsF